MRARTRDFIYTADDLFFATTNYLHPEDRIISFLRYIPDQEGERSKNNSRYSKVDSKQAYEFINRYHPDYLFDCDITNAKMMGVPLNKVSEILKPNDRLKEIIKHPTNELFKKVVEVAAFFHEHAGISYQHMGISGSILPGLCDLKNSDIDLMIIGEKKRETEVERVISLLPLDIHLIFFTYEEFLSMALSKEFSVVLEVIKRNVILIGIEDYYRLMENVG